MDVVRNPFNPGAGSKPPELAGREELRVKVDVAIQRVRAGRSSNNFLMVGLRGVGKTVLLNRMTLDAEASGILVVALEIPEDASLPALLIPRLNTALLKLSRTDRATDLARRAMRGLAGLARAIKLKYGEFEIGIEESSEPGLADSGHLDADLPELLQAIGEAARAGETAVVLAMDEVQNVPTAQLGALIAGLHRCAQRSLPVMVIGAGLPQLRARVGEAKSYAERMFEFPRIGPLDRAGAIQAISAPIEAEGAEITEVALSAIYAQTRGYAYFLQQWGAQVWNVADDSPITEDDVNDATEIAVATLDESFFRVRFDRLTPKEKQYLRAMAALGEGPYRSADVAEALDRTLQQLSRVRSSLVAKGMIWSPTYGETEFTVPLFDEFMRRTMPGDDWRA